MTRIRWALGMLILMGGVAQAAQILVNPGFESGALSPWVNGLDSGGTPWAITTTDCHSGTFCAEDNGNIELNQTFGPIATTSITGVSFWALHTLSDVNLLAYDFLYQGDDFDEFTVNTSGTGWNFFDVFAQLRANDTLVGFSIFGNSEGVTRADDFSITTGASVPEPSTAGLLLAGFGLVGLAAYYRKRRPALS